MKICIIDDEKNNREILHYLIKQIDKEVEIIGEAENVTNGIKIINLHKPDLIFLDIDLPDGTGFDLIKKLNIHKPEIIFCTAHNQFALKAIECSALAYILKPIIKESVRAALQKANLKISDNSRLLQYDVLAEQLKTKATSRERFLITTSERMHIIHLDELICCIAHSNYTDIYLENNKKITVAKTLKELEIMLSNYLQIIRIHQSNIINIDKIIDLIKVDNSVHVLLKNDIELAVSRSKKEELLARL